MVSVGIIGIALLSALPGIRERTPAYWLDHVSSSAQAQLMSARTQAVSQRCDVTVVFTDMGDTIQVTKEADRDDSGTIVGDERTITSIDYADTLTLTLPALEAVFSSSGAFSSPDTNWHLKFTNTDAEDQYIYIFANGHVQPSDNPM